MSSYFRSYDLTISPKSGKALSLIQNRDTPGLAIEFNIQKSDTEQSNPATVKIYNPNESTIAKIQASEFLRLEAGYHKKTGIILIGRINNTSVDINGSEVAVTIEVETRPPVPIQINKSLSKGSTNIQIIDELVKFIIDNLPEVEGKNPYVIPEIISYKSAVTLVGDPYEILLQYLTPIKHIYIVDNGVITILPTGGFVLDSVINLSPSNGMIGSPHQIKEEIKGKDEKKQGVEVKSILNHNFAPRRILNLTSKKASGRYTISTVTFSGNSFSGDWITTVRAFV